VAARRRARAPLYCAPSARAAFTLRISAPFDITPHAIAAPRARVYAFCSALPTCCRTRWQRRALLRFARARRANAALYVPRLAFVRSRARLF